MMTPSRLLNLALVAAMALVLSCSYLLDGPDDIEAMQDVATDVQDAIQTAQANEVQQ